ncbi:3'-5' exoribonuclease domain-containing protein [Flindersiella endophytica]
MSRLWFDTEFIDDGRTVSLLSIGVVRDDDAAYYAEPAEADRSASNPWVRAHVLPLLTGPVLPRAEIAKQVREFAGPAPEWWASFGAYDWVLLCQLYGPLEDHPPGWPWFCRDVQQYAEHLGVDLTRLAQPVGQHNALADAHWTRAAWQLCRDHDT